MHRLEALLGSIVQEDDPRSQAILAELNSPLETAYGELIRPRPMRRETVAEYEVEDRLMKQDINEIKQSQLLDSDDSNHTDNIDESGQLRYYGKTNFYTSNQENVRAQVNHHHRHH